MDKLSVVILTKNEEQDIINCLESIKWADDIVIVDDFSSDNTVQICKRYTSRVFQNKMTGFSKQWEFGIRQARGPWILTVDADHVVSSPLQIEIQEILKNGTDCDGFMIYRTTSYLGKWIKGCGWRVKVLVLFKKEKASYDGKLVHEKIILRGKIGNLKNEIYHTAYKNLSEHFTRMDLYTSYDAEDLWKKGVRLCPINYPIYLFLKPTFIFLRKYIFLGGFKEGVRGFL